MDFIQLSHTYRLSREDNSKTYNVKSYYFRLYERRSDSFGAEHYEQVWSGRDNDYVGNMVALLFATKKESK